MTQNHHTPEKCCGCVIPHQIQRGSTQLTQHNCNIQALLKQTAQSSKYFLSSLRFYSSASCLLTSHIQQSAHWKRNEQKSFYKTSLHVLLQNFSAETLALKDWELRLPYNLISKELGLSYAFFFFFLYVLTLNHYQVHSCFVFLGSLGRIGRADGAEIQTRVCFLLLHLENKLKWIHT